jgi:hypothetical protein
MALAEDSKALQELRDRGQLSDAAYPAPRNAAFWKLAPKVFYVIVILLVGLGIFINIYDRASRGERVTLFHKPLTITDEVENIPATSWKALNYGFPSGGKLDITIRVVNGNPIDILLVNTDQLEAINKGEWRNVRTYADFNVTNARTYHRTEFVRPGNYYLVLRDTSFGVQSAHASDVSVKTILTP